MPSPALNHNGRVARRYIDLLKLLNCVWLCERRRPSLVFLASLRCLAWPLGFEGLLAANVDFDLLGLGFGLLRQLDF